jgi:glycerol-3-phosphate dehydrogenase (NAD(P)+)
MASARENIAYLPGIELPSALAISDDPSACMDGVDMVISVVPSRYLREVWEKVAEAFPDGAHLVSATKGLEDGSFLRMTEVLAEYSGGREASLSALSGPSFAAELATNHPTAATLGCADEAAAEAVQSALSGGCLRVYRNADVLGVEYGGALKNVIAIATGISDGLGFGTNSRAALITRGLKELTALATARGGEPTTMMGLAGLGDLVLTCTGPLSRNRKVGVELGRGARLDDIIASMQMVAEGVETSAAAHHLGRQSGVPMPITAEVDAILHEGKAPRAAIEDLMSRTLVPE